ncbi:MAG: GNAT family N-acetyltransferase [Chloroflexota bacterium]
MMEISRLQNDAEAQICAKMMAKSEPWVTLQRDEQASSNMITDPLREVYLAKQGEEIQGFVVIVMQGAFVGYIQSICVAPDVRGQGIGKKLMTFAEERIFRDAPNVFICVSSFNPRVQSLYLKLGYQLIGEIKDYIVKGHSEMLLRKTVGPIT